MSFFQRIKSFLTGIFLLAVVAFLIIAPKDAYDFIYVILSIMMLFYGLRLLWYYFSMARHMVGGKIVLYQAIIVLDAGLFTMTIAKMSDFIVLAYLLGIYAIAGVIDILRALEAKKNDSPIWKRKIIIGTIEAGFAVLLVIVGVTIRDINFMVYGFAVSLASTAVLKIYDAFRSTAIVFIQ